MTGRKAVNRKGRSTSKSTKIKNKPPKGKAWAWFTVDILESDAFKFLNINARKILDSLILENMHHAAQTNGDLICTYKDFQDYGVTYRYIPESLKQLKIAGFIRVRGGEFNGQTKPPNIYTLTIYATHDGHGPTNEWKGKKMEEMKEEYKAYKEQRASRKQLSKEN